MSNSILSRRPSPATSNNMRAGSLSLSKIEKKNAQVMASRCTTTFLFLICLSGIFLVQHSLRVPAGNAPAIRTSEINQPTRPDGWESYSRSDVRDHYDCRTYASDHKRAMPSLEYWRLLRKQYNHIVDGKKDLNDPVPPTDGYTLGEKGSPPFYAKYADDKGRGLFATRDIKKGELVHDGTGSDVVFPNAKLWRKFIFSIPQHMACDVTEWQWTQTLKKGGKLRICLAPSIASLMNTSDNSPNILPNSDTSTKMYALRDIKKEEEILMDYSIYETSWSKVGI